MLPAPLQNCGTHLAPSNLNLELGEPIEVGIKGGPGSDWGKEFGKCAGQGEGGWERGPAGAVGEGLYPDRAPAFPDWRVWKN